MHRDAGSEWLTCALWAIWILKSALKGREGGSGIKRLLGNSSGSSSNPSVPTSSPPVSCHTCPSDSSTVPARGGGVWETDRQTERATGSWGRALSLSPASVQSAERPRHCSAMSDPWPLTPLWGEDYGGDLGGWELLSDVALSVNPVGTLFLTPKSDLLFCIVCFPRNCLSPPSYVEQQRKKLCCLWCL